MPYGAVLYVLGNSFYRQSFVQYVYGSIYVPVMHFSAGRAFPFPNSRIEFFLLLSAGVTYPAARIVRRHFNDGIAIPFCLVFKHAEELRPRNIVLTSVHISFLLPAGLRVLSFSDYVFHRNIFKTDSLVLAYQPC